MQRCIFFVGRIPIVSCLWQTGMAATSGKSTHLQTFMPADYEKELQDEELHSLGVHMLATRSNGDDTTRPRLSVWVWCEAEKTLIAQSVLQMLRSAVVERCCVAAVTSGNWCSCLDCTIRSRVWTSLSWRWVVIPWPQWAFRRHMGMLTAVQWLIEDGNLISLKKKCALT